MSAKRQPSGCGPSWEDPLAWDQTLDPERSSLDWAGPPKQPARNRLGFKERSNTLGPVGCANRREGLRGAQYA